MGEQGSNLFVSSAKEDKNEKYDLLKAAQQLNAGQVLKHRVHIEYGDLKGYFTFKYPSVGDHIRIASEQSKYFIDGVPQAVSAFGANLAYKSATLKVITVESPMWFKVTNPEDNITEELLDMIFEQYYTWYDGVKNNVKKN